MELKETIRNRRTIRCFLPEPVPEETIKELIADALWAPSWKNAQPWELVVATGEILERFKKENREALLAGKTTLPDIPIPKGLPNPFKDRYADLNDRVYEALSIEAHDTKRRVRYYANMYALFDAPALIMMLLDKRLSIEYAMLDIGIFVQTFCLLAYERLLGTAILSAVVHCPHIVHRIFSIPDTKLLVVGIALGWPDENAPVNRFERKRGAIDEFVRWIQ
ncbi:MAG: nitroreductase [Desulfobacterales bacterium]|jgi:nitroreductase